MFLPIRFKTTQRRNPRRTLTLLVVLIAAATTLVACEARHQTTHADGPSPAESDVSQLSSEAMREAISNALDERDTLDRATRLTQLLQGLHKENLPGAVDAFGEDMARMEDWEIRLFAAAYARVAPAEAMDYVRTWTYPKLGASALDEIIYGWTRAGGARELADYAERTIIEPADEPQEVADNEVAVLPRKVKEKKPNYIISTMVRALAVEGEGDEVIRILSSYPPSEKSNLVLTSAVTGFRRNGAEALETWIKSIPVDTPNGVYARAWKSAIGIQAKLDASVSAGWYEIAEPNLDPADGSLQNWTVDWAAQDPEAALLWLLERPDNRDRFEAIRAVAYRWLKKDGPAAHAWLLAEQDRPGVLEPTLFPLVQYVMTVDLEESAEMAHRIPRPNEKARALKQGLMALARRDLEALKRHLETHDVPQSVLETLEVHHGPKLRTIGVPPLNRKG